jgi:hypothetical protein
MRSLRRFYGNPTARADGSLDALVDARKVACSQRQNRRAAEHGAGGYALYFAPLADVLRNARGCAAAA